MEEHQVATIVKGSDSCKDLILDHNLYEHVVKGESKSITESALQAHLHYHNHHPSESSAPHHRKDTILHFAVKVGRMDCIKQILELRPSLLACQNSKGDTALHIAARNGRDDVVKLFINPPNKQIRSTSTSNPDDDIESRGEVQCYEATDHVVRMENDKKDTALHEAVRNHRLFDGKRLKNYLDVLKLLTEADPKFECFPNTAGETPLYMAAEEGLYDFALQILKACPSSACGGPYGRTALHAAIFGRHERIIRILLEKMQKDKTRDMIRKADNDERTALHFAALWASPGIAKMLIKKEISVAYKKDKGGILPVHLAAERDELRIFNLFFDHCPDCFEHVDHNGWNALHFAAGCSSGGAISILRRVLISGDNELLKGMANEGDNEGNTPLHVAVKSGNIMSVDVFLRSSVVDKLAINNDCFTPLDLIELDTNKDPTFQECTRTFIIREPDPFTFSPSHINLSPESRSAVRTRE
ncbi:ankyrin repeat-containing protein At5g02620-like isoform X2 [Macadamia integrifolia]|uniref:ankyrin repeat-containing protein At5g02620-like isoform X2 n=1 Tax=Macadamia integrifolia TaxID=60698 RepID=UPI001C4F512E|nr:ankyrin repeat-containing protein At5g02620-like isoform X2 [Macadamia integrifolia]